MSINYPPESYLRRTLAGAGLLFRLALLAAVAAFATQVVAAQVQAPANSPAATPAKKSPRHGARPAEAPAPVQTEPAPPQPETPQWPVNETPNKASVTWDSHGLRIAASNSSLHQILNEVAAETGAKVEGLGSDERVFGEYGPGEARDVISQLLHGSSYNVLMIGDQGSGTPREIVLSNRHAGKNPATANQNEPNQDTGDEDYSEQPEVDEQPPPQPQMINGGRPPMPIVPQGPPGAPRTPQQVLQELQQRQQQIQDQQQQQQQQQQPPQ